VTMDGVVDFNYISNDSLSIIILQNKSLLGALSVYEDNQVFYFIDENIFEVFNKTLGKTSVTSDYKAFLGREKIKFQYIHAADDTSRIDPSSSNIIDTYILTRGYDTQFRQYLDGIRTYSPVINEGGFVGGASDRSEVIEGRGGDVSAGNFLQRTESNKEKGFYKKGEKGMKVAEVTGNEVIMPADRQNKIEKALASGDTETPGKIMKQTLAEGKVTKGDASHDSNPMPIMSTGAVLDKNGKDTGLKADSGTGIYHQASKQFKPGMSNSEMTKIIKKNIQSWKKQGKAWLFLKKKYIII